MYKWVIFDVDGTLINTEEAVTSAYQRVAFEEFGVCFEPEVIALARKVPTRNAMKMLGFSDVEGALEKYHKYLMDSFRRAKPFRGIPLVLERLQESNIVTGLVTSRNSREVEDDVCIQGMKKYFDIIVCAEDTEKHKPDPEPLLKFIELSGANASETIYVGDLYNDYICARKAGVHFALALWGTKDTNGVNADHNLKEPEDLLDII